MEIIVKKNPKPVICTEFEIVEPNVLDWLNATKDGRYLSLAGDGTIRFDNGTLSVLQKLVLNCGLFDGKKKSEMEVNNLPLGFFISLLGELLGNDSFLMDTNESLEAPTPSATEE
jgi:hypothetical protein